MKNKHIHLGLATEEQVNQKFIQAWHEAEQETGNAPEEHIYFVDPATFFQVLSRRRIALLKTLHRYGAASIRELSRILERDYKNVHQDVQLLKNVGLIHLDASRKIYVPWDAIQAEIPLAA